MFTCKDCSDRYPGCHGKCEKYIREKAEYERCKEREKARKLLDEYDIRTGQRLKKAKKYKNVRTG